MTYKFIEKRSEPRNIIDQYYSVEFLISGCVCAYQFKIWDISSKGVCVLVKEDSDLLNYIKVGDILDLKYYKTDSSEPPEYLKTGIKHITKDEKGRFKGAYLVGLSIPENQNSKKEETTNIVCPRCTTSYIVPNNILPQGRSFVATCKMCGDKIVIPSGRKQPDHRAQAEPVYRVP